MHSIKYIRENKEIILDCINQKKSDINLSSYDLYEFFRWSGIQRNMRILGTLANLYCEEGRDFRLKDLPNILSNLIHLISDDHNSKGYLKDVVENRLNERLISL